MNRYNRKDQIIKQRACINMCTWKHTHAYKHNHSKFPVSFFLIFRFLHDLLKARALVHIVYRRVEAKFLFYFSSINRYLQNFN